MAFYEVDQYELYFQSYQVEAESEADAIAKVLNGDPEEMDEMGELEYVGLANDYGILVDCNQELVDAIRLHDPSIQIKGVVISSIRDVREVE